MSFISFSFLFFFVICGGLYYLIQKFFSEKAIFSQILLLLASVFFYSFADLRFLPFLFYTGILSCLFGLVDLKNRKWIFVLFIILDLFPLLFFKYFNFIISPFTTTKFNLILPLGISFFTFQSLGYLIDIRKEKISAEKNPITVFLFISFFPSVTSGPIQRACDLIPQLKKAHSFDYKSATDGMKLFAWGMFKKIVVADFLAVYVDLVYSNPSEKYGCALALATLIYTFQIYFDFSGYSDMAIGIARFFGFELKKNFEHPYFSSSCGEFWKRWHISLSSWLRDYVYIPLGGSRVSTPRIYLNLMITFLVSGIWHGAAWTFIIWGVLHGIYQCFGRMIKPLKEKMKLPMWLNILVTFLLVSFAWSFFRADSLQNSLTIAKKIFMIPYEVLNVLPSLIKDFGMKQTLRNLFFLNAEACDLKGIANILVRLIFVMMVDVITFKKDGLEIVSSKPAVIRWILYIALVLSIEILMPTTLSSNFIYNSF